MGVALKISLLEIGRFLAPSELNALQKEDLSIAIVVWLGSTPWPLCVFSPLPLP